MPPEPKGPGRPANRAKRVKASARRVALDVLDGCLGDRPRAAELIFEQHPDLERLSRRDRAFARLLYACVFRRLRGLDACLRPHLQRWPKDLTLLNCLRLGTAQLHILDTPVHAAIGETVALAKTAAPFGARMVNAVLRRVAEAPLAETEGMDLPDWLIESWRQAYGDETAKAIQSSLQPAALDVTIAHDRDLWCDRLQGGPLGAVSIRLGMNTPVEELPGYQDGVWWVQDAAAAAIIPLLGDLAGMRALDIGAAPGGKTAQLIHAGARVTAVENVPGRAERLRANLGRLRLNAEILVADARTYEAGEPFDLVLLDAPCTATGTLRRHPDIAWARQPRDVLRMAGQQQELLDNAARLTGPGGHLVYAVCSLQPPEGEGQIAAFLQRHAGWQRLPFDPAWLPNLPATITENGDYRALPSDAASIGGMDGFFAARLQAPAS